MGNSTESDSPAGEGSILTSLWTYSAIVILLSFSAMFSGLTLGLMSLDKIGLEIVIGAGQAEGADDQQRREARYAQQIQPLREDGNLLLCTLLLGNVAVNSLLSILMADLTGGTTGFLVSTAAIVIMGEIVPQATCSRYALRIGSFAVPVVRFIKYLLLVFTWPLSKMLNVILGDEIGTIHGRGELMKLLRIHVDHHALEKEEGDIVMGALSYKDIAVEDVMTPIKKVKMLCVTDRLNFQVRHILPSCCSRAGYIYICVCAWW